MTAHFEDDPGADPDDPLTVLLRPAPEYVSPPEGRYRSIRRKAALRRLLRTAAGVGVSCAVAAIIVLPLHLKSARPPATPSAPLVPPAASSTPAVPPAPASPKPVSPRPTPTSAPPTTPPPSRVVEPPSVPYGVRPTATPAVR